MHKNVPILKCIFMQLSFFYMQKCEKKGRNNVKKTLPTYDHEYNKTCTGKKQAYEATS